MMVTVEENEIDDVDGDGLDNSSDTKAKVKGTPRKMPTRQDVVVDINENFRFILHTDDVFQLQMKTVYDDGTDTFVFYGWFGDLGSLMKKVRSGIRNEKIRENGSDGINAVIAAEKYADEQITKYFGYGDIDKVIGEIVERKKSKR